MKEESWTFDETANIATLRYNFSISYLKAAASPTVRAQMGFLQVFWALLWTTVATRAVGPPWLENPIYNYHANISVSCLCSKSYSFLLMNPTGGHHLERKQDSRRGVEFFKASRLDVQVTDQQSLCCLAAPLIKKMSTNVYQEMSPPYLQFISLA